MKEIQKPSSLLLVSILVGMFFTIFVLALSTSCPYFWNKLILIVFASLGIVLGVLQLVLYVKNYIDYRFNEIELKNKNL